jgi:hypothetical protein
MTGTRDRERAELRQAALDRVITALTASLAELHQAEALQAVTEAGAARGISLRDLDQHLANHPDALISGEAHCPPVIVRLAKILHAAGHTAVIRPSCTDCGRSDVDLPRRGPRGRLCVNCATRSSKGSPPGEPRGSSATPATASTRMSSRNVLPAGSSACPSPGFRTTRRSARAVGLPLSAPARGADPLARPGRTAPTGRSAFPVTTDSRGPSESAAAAVKCNASPAGPADHGRISARTATTGLPRPALSVDTSVPASVGLAAHGPAEAAARG